MKTTLNISRDMQPLFSQVLRYAGYFLKGLLLAPCTQIHTLGMRYPLDINFLDKAGAVMKCVEALKPNRFGAATKAHYTLKVSSVGIVRTNLNAGVRLSWEGLD